MGRAHHLIGIEEIDREHKKLMGLFDEAAGRLADGGSRPEVHFTLARLRTHMEIQFLVEESLLRMTAYPGIPEHAQQHRAILHDIVGLEVESGKTFPDIDKLQKARRAMIRHIRDADRHYAGYLAAGATIGVTPVDSPADLDIEADEFPLVHLCLADSPAKATAR